MLTAARKRERLGVGRAERIVGGDPDAAFRNTVNLHLEQ